MKKYDRAIRWFYYKIYEKNKLLVWLATTTILSFLLYGLLNLIFNLEKISFIRGMFNV